MDEVPGDKSVPASQLPIKSLHTVAPANVITKISTRFIAFCLSLLAQQPMTIRVIRPFLLARNTHQRCQWHLWNPRRRCNSTSSAKESRQNKVSPHVPYPSGESERKIGFYISFGRPMAKILIIAAITYQVLKFLGSDDDEATGNGRL